MALFPLGIFLLPGERTPLHIFEARYQQLFAEVESDGLEFGILFTGQNDLTHGAKCRLLRVTKRYPNGESDVLIECTGVFLLKNFQEAKSDKLYPYGTVELMGDLDSWTVSEKVATEYSKYIEVMQQSKLPFGHPEGNAFIPILSSLNMGSNEKFELIRMTDVEMRNETLLNSIRYARMLVAQENAIENGVYLS